MRSGGCAGSGRALRLDPFGLPVRFCASDAAADGRVRDIELHRERVVLRRSLSGMRMALNMPVKAFDGTLGWSAYGPYDGILVAAAGPQIPEPLTTQLKVGGRLVIPVGATRESQKLMRVIKNETGLKIEDHGSCQFVPLIGQHGWGKT